MPIMNGLYNGVEYFAFNADNDGARACTDFLYGIVEDNADNSVISVFMAPKAFYSAESAGEMPNRHRLHSVDPYIEEYIIRFFRSNKMFDGYVPKNNKLYTFPFCALALDTLSCCTVYRWEWFKNLDENGARFEFMGALSPNSEFRISPKDYSATISNNPGHTLVNYTASNFITGFPQCAWAIDTYAAWLAQKSTGEYLNIASTTVGAVAAGFNRDIAGAAQGLLGLASQLNAQVIEQSRGDTPRGNIGGMVDCAGKIKGAYFKSMTITGEYARQIDSFFTKYGYSVNRIKRPSRRNRKYFTYVKTRDCQIRLSGFVSIPCDAVEKIKSIYNNGVTFWTKDATPGDYSYTNSLV